jgi:uncharacterized lipoprotein YddW (UPF0748 family)
MANPGLAVWSHGITDFGGRDDIPRRADTLAENGIDILIPCVKNPPGAVDFQTDLADVNPDYPDWDPLKVLIEACRARDVKVHPWFCVFPEGEQSRLLREHPEFTAVMDGDRRWACACIEEVQDYVFGLYEGLVQRYRPDGLHLDYIRTGGICKCDFCRRELDKRGVDIDTVEGKNPAFEVWTDWRVSRIKDFVRRVHGLTGQNDMELSAAVFAHYPACVRTQGQDWVRWAEEGRVDYLFPMNYTNSTRDAVALTVTHAALIKGRVPLWEGLGRDSSDSLLSADGLEKQARAVLAAGADGVVVFKYKSLTSEDLAVFRQLKGS